MKHRQKYFINFLSSYILIFAIPLIYIVFFFTNQYMEVLRRDIEEKQMASLISLKEEMDRNFDQINSIHTHLQLNKIFKPLYNLSDGNRAREIILELKSYLVSNVFIDSIAIYYKEDNYIYDETSSCELDSYFTGYYIIDGWEGENVFDRINSVGSPTLIRAVKKGYSRNSQGTPCLLLAVPFRHYNRRNPNGLVVYRIPERTIDHLLIKNNEKKYTALLMTGRKDEIHFSLYNSDRFPDLDDAVKIPDLYLKNNNYIRKSLSSDILEIHYTSLLSKDSYGELRAVQNRFLISLTLLFLFSCLLTWLSMKLNYNPILKLFNYGEMIKEKMNLPDDGEGDNFDSLIHTLDYLFTESSHSSSSRDPIDENTLAKKLIQGCITDQDDLVEQAGELGFFFTRGQYTVFTVHLHMDRGQRENFEAGLTEKIISLIRENFTAVIFNDPDIRRFVVPCSAGLDREELDRSLEKFHRELRELAGAGVTIGTGGIYHAPGDLAKAYQDSLIALDYMLIKGSDRIIAYQPDFSYPADTDRPYPYKELDTLYYRILQLDKEGTKENLTQIIDQIKSGDFPLFIIRRICFDLINNTYKAVNEISSNILVTSHQYPVPTDLADFETVDDILTSLNGYFEKLYRFIDLYKEKRSGAVIESMHQYIRENYLDYNFSVQVMADHFEMSLANISQYYKKNTGQTIIDFTTRLRIEKAKDLLEKKEMSVNEVVRAVGYASTSSFIRKFKQLTGYTPRQYSEKKI